MITLGYIVSSQKINEMPNFVERVTSQEKILSTKPILIIGWAKAKNDNRYTSILNKELDNNTSWTFGKNEKRDEMANDLEAFYSRCLKEKVKETQYLYLDPTKMDMSTLKRAYKALFLSQGGNVYYITNEMLYGLINGVVCGVSFKVLKYCGVSIKKFYSRLYKNQNNKIFKDNDEDVISLKRYLNPNKYYSIPYYLKEEE